MIPACPHCHCTACDDGRAHAMQAMLMADDLDAALQLGLLDALIAQINALLRPYNLWIPPRG